MPLRLGDEAPDFRADTTEGPIHLYGWMGDKWVMLFSHPKDFTPVCTTELGYTAKLKGEFAKRGVKVKGYEYSARARAVAHNVYGIDVLSFDLNNFIGDSSGYDLSLCIEVAHYLPPTLGDRLVELCATNVSHALFSAAHPGQHGFGHVNAQPRDYWIDRFRSHGFRLNERATDALGQHLHQRLKRGFWLAENVFLLERVG